MYDADAWVDPRPRMAFRFRGVEYVGVPLGTQMMLTFANIFAQAAETIASSARADGETQPPPGFRRRLALNLAIRRQEDVIRQFFRAAYPRPWWIRWFVRSRDPVWMLMHFTPEQRDEVLEYFFDRVARGPAPRVTPTTTPGNGSTAATSPAAPRTGAVPPQSA